MATPAQTRTINIKVDAPGVKEALSSIQNAMGGVNKSVKGMSSNLGFLTGAFKTWLGYLGSRELAQMSDQFQNLNNRLKNVIRPGEDLKDVLAQLNQVAQNNGIAISAVGDTFSRFGQAMSRVGATSEEVLTLTDLLTKTFRVAGATSEETANAMIQLSQAFGIGVLRGQDLRSVMSQNVVIAGLLQKTYGADLFKKAEKGMITISEVLKILNKDMASIDDKSKNLSMTFQQTLTKAINTITLKVGELSERLNLPGKFSDTVSFLLDNFENLAILLGGALFIKAILSLQQFVVTLQALAASSRLFAAANPWLLALTAVATIGVLVYNNWEKVSKLFDGIGKKLGEVLDKAASLNPELRRQEALLSLMQGKGQASKTEVYGPPELFGPPEALKAQAKSLDSLIKKYAELTPKVETLDQFYRRMNKGFAEGAVSFEQYNKRIDSQNLEVLKLKIEGLPDSLEKLKRKLAEVGITESTKQFNMGTIGVKEYQAQVDRFELSKLRSELARGRINLFEFQEKLLELPTNANNIALAMSVGVNRFVSESGNMARGVASLVTQTFDSLGDTFVEFTKTGEFNFAKMTQAILDDLNRIIIKSAVIAPLAQGLMSAIGIGVGAAAGGLGGASGGGGGGLTLGNDYSFAKGGIMTSSGPMQLQKYSRGGIASSPQLAMFGEGRRPEAYVPLPDGKNIPVQMEGGGGGIQFSQTIIIQSDGSATSTEKNTGGGEGAARFADIMKRVAQDTIIQQMRAGGVLANKYG